MKKLIFLVSIALVCASACTKKSAQQVEDEGIFAEYTSYGVVATVQDGQVIITREEGDLEGYGLPVLDENARLQVEGLKGACKGVYIGNRGGDPNPLLCMLLEDGTVQAINVLNAVMDGKFIAGDKVSGFTNIVKFGSYIQSDEFTTTAVTYAVDKDGKKHEFSYDL